MPLPVRHRIPGTKRTRANSVATHNSCGCSRISPRGCACARAGGIKRPHSGTSNRPSRKAKCKNWDDFRRRTKSDVTTSSAHDISAHWWGSGRRFVLSDGSVTVGRSFLRIFLWPRNPVSRKRRPREAETRFECRLGRRKSEHLVLPRPRGGHVGEAGHSHATRQPPRDGRFHEIGRQEGKRDRHVDLANAAPLALGNAFRICGRVGKKFVEPAASARNRCDQERAGLRAYRTSVLRWKPRGQKDLPAPR